MFAPLNVKDNYATLVAKAYIHEYDLVMYVIYELINCLCQFGYGAFLVTFTQLSFMHKGFDATLRSQEASTSMCLVFSLNLCNIEVYFVVF